MVLFFLWYLNDRRYVALMSEDLYFNTIPDVGERQNIKSEYHVYWPGKKRKLFKTLKNKRLDCRRCR